MIRKAPRVDTLKLLYTLSGNTCAFPKCEHPIFNDKGLYIAELCHIEAAVKGGPRFNPTRANNERNSCTNLMFMCHRHHKETDDIHLFTVKKLKKIKANHEKQFTEEGKKATNEMIRQIKAEMTHFWIKQKQKEFKVPEMKLKGNFDFDIIQLFSELEKRIKDIRDYCNVCMDSDSDEKLEKDFREVCKKLNLNFKDFSSLPYYENPFYGRNWEMHNIGRPNLFSILALCTAQLRLKVFDELLKYNPKDLRIKKLIEKQREEFDKSFNKSYYVD